MSDFVAKEGGKVQEMMGALLKRHCAGDYGKVTADTKQKNVKHIKEKKGMVISKYPVVFGRGAKVMVMVVSKLEDGVSILSFAD